MKTPRDRDEPAARQRLTDRKREAILRAAAEAFRHDGFRATSADRIAELAGVSKRTLYNHFASKDALFDAVIEGYWQRLVPLAQGAAGDDPTADAGAPSLPVRERLASLARARMTVLLDPEVLGVFRMVLAESLRMPELARAFRQGAQHLELLGFLPLVRSEAARGRLRCDDPERAAEQLWALVFEGLFWPSVMLLRTRVTRDDRERAIAEGVTTFLARYGAPAAASPRPAGARASSSSKKPRTNAQE